MASFALFTLPWFLIHVSAQTAQAPLQTVHVGRSGSSYEPSSLNARSGEVIQFIFEGRAHGIVQSGDGTPCVPLSGGFRSGVAGPGIGNQSSNSSAPPVWNLVITNASAPIWFFCPVSTPMIHCQQGMVGVINPPNQTAFSQYASLARAFTGTVDPTLGSPSLSGIDASATASPTPIVTSASSSSSTSTPTSTPSTVQVTPASMTSDNDGSHTAAIVGGTIAGVVAIMATIIIVTLIIRKRTRRSNRDAMNATTHFPGSTESPPNTGMSERSGFSTGKYSIERRVGSPPARTGPGVITPFYSTPRENPNELPSSNTTASDYTRARTSPELEMRKQTSNNTLRPLRGVASDERIQRIQHPYAAPHGRSNSGGGDEDAINELAKEVAAVLLRDGGVHDTTAVAGGSTGSGDRNKPPGPRTKGGSEPSDPPPHYRSDLGHIA